jgi:hypothetical protein
MMNITQTIITGAHGCAIYDSSALGKVHVNFTLTRYSRVFVQSVQQVGPHSWAELTSILTPHIIANVEAEITAHLKQKIGTAA